MFWPNTTSGLDELQSLRTSSKFPQHRYHQPPQEGTAAKHFFFFLLLRLQLLLLCGIPFCRLIKKRQAMVASDKGKENALHRVHRFLNTYYLFDLLLITKNIFMGKSSHGGEVLPPLPTPNLPTSLCPCVSIYPRRRRSWWKGGGGKFSLSLSPSSRKSVTMRVKSFGIQQPTWTANTAAM